MTITQLNGSSISCGLTSRTNKWKPCKRIRTSHSLEESSKVYNFCPVNRKVLGRSCHLSAECRYLLSPLVICRRNSCPRVVHSQSSSDCGVESVEVEETLALGEDNGFSSLNEEVLEVKTAPLSGSYPLDVKRELIMLSLPALAGQAIDPLAQLLETAYIGRLGSVELGSAGVSMSIFNVISKLFNIPLLSVATSFVAEDISKNGIMDLASEWGSPEQSPNVKHSIGVAERKQLSSVTTALLLAVGIGLFEALALSFGSGPFLRLMGLSHASEMYIPAQKFLSLRALGAPAFVVSLALQGIFRGFKDTKTPVYCLGIGNLLAVFLFPLLIYHFRMGVAGAAISTVVSQYIVAFLMILYLNKRVVLLPPKLGALQFGSYIKSGGFVLGRTLAVLMTMTLATSMAARQGSVAMAAHQICMQIWLAVSLLTDALAASGQALIASSVSKGDFKRVREVTSFVLKIGLITGISLAVILGLSFGSLASWFTKDAEVLGIVRTGVLFVGATQPLTALAFIFDGLHYGMSDFPYAACSMMLVGAISSAVLLYVPSVMGLHGVWLGLTLFMGLRMIAGFVRLLSKSGPWWFMHGDFHRAELAN